ncbi:kinesin-like protein Klp98A [Lepeophtheirus salmonis]|uniref:Kinesinlike protein KIF16Blike [Bombyx mori] n=1 Tax=Lepeophtheirus salmonis TaxID=72036 RepID=A0A0K2TAZ4_LEPSM|nr:kinesin-like protein KIF16B [Lepeophtheirus salmonis]
MSHGCVTLSKTCSIVVDVATWFFPLGFVLWYLGSGVRMASVRVAVRVRPLNVREVSLGSGGVVWVEEECVMLCGGEGKAHRFSFDYAYDSGSVTQETLFGNLGLDVVSKAFKGYNVCVFAYGQTGSGKTHTMMGTGEDPGLIPRICGELFERMKTNGKSRSYRTQVSYLEIYNEKVKDLLGEKKGSTTSTQQHNLKVREDPRSGPYVENLSKHLVLEYDELIALMAKGNSERTTASTNMNNTSSRSHAIFTITFTQASILQNGLPRETISKVHLVDLAGSERADATGATGQRLKEGAHINKSLVTLGSVISALADASNNQTNKKVFVPYRDSVLTWLLKDSLGGNSQTIMIATISPAGVNYSETLSTLRYANRAKNIINKPTVNEDPNVKLIRELREEIERLKKTLIRTTPDPIVATEIAVKEARERTLTEAWTEKWKEAANILSEQKALGLKRTGLGVVLDSEKPHLIGIVEDVLSTGIILYHLKEGDTVIGTNELPDSDIILRGPAILSKHCVINLKNGIAKLIPEDGALCLVNASRIVKSVKLSQGCVIVLGKTNMFRYNDPLEIESLRKNMSISSDSQPFKHSLLSESFSDLRTSRNGDLQLNSYCSEDELPKTDNKIIQENANLEGKKENESVEGEGSSRFVEINSRNCDSTSTLSLSSCHSTTQSDDDYIITNRSNSGNINSFTDCNLHSKDEFVPMITLLSSDQGDTVKLYNKILEQKEVIMKCLENENVDVESFNVEISHLQEMQAKYEKLEFERMRNLWLFSKTRQTIEGDHDVDNIDYEEKLAILVEQEVDRRLFQEKILKAESEYNEREHLRSECEREINFLRRQHEREIYILKRKLYESHLAAVSATSLEPRNSVLGLNQAFPAILAIPKYRLVCAGTVDAHVEYEIKITFCCEQSCPSYTVHRRYKTFRDLHRMMISKYNVHLTELNFPPRRFIGSSLSESLSNERQKALQIYLNRLIQICYKVQCCPLVKIKDVSRALCVFSSFFQRDD